MRARHLAMLVVVLATTGCASTKADKVAICDGKHRRPANAYGTVLPTIPLPGAPAAEASRTPDPAKPPSPAATPGPQSRLDLRSFASCGRPT
jgi:hypothetical protein